MDKTKTINHIKENALCTACGGCEGICPTNAIKMTTNVAGFIVPLIDMNKCTNCGMCYEICPSVKENTKNLYQENIFHGNYLQGYIGYAVDKDIRQNSQSGGVVTALLIYLLEKGYIEGAAVNKFNSKTKKVDVVIAKTKQEIIEASGSYYVQSSVLSETLNQDNSKLAAVTLGCQSGSLHLIKNKYSNITLPEYNFGLICSGEYSEKYIDYLINLSSADRNKVNKFRFKDKSTGGWPGNVKIYTEEDDYVLNKTKRTSMKPVFMNHRCIMCFDQMNIYSDIVFGDPWGIKDETNKKGNTVMIIRNKKGKELIKKATQEGYIKIKELNVKDILKGQTVDGRLKTQFFTALDINKKNNFLSPYDENYFFNINYEKPKNNKKKEIENKFNFSRKVFLSKNIDYYNNLIDNKIRKIKKQQLLKKIKIFPKRIIRYSFKIFKNKLGIFFRDK